MKKIIYLLILLTPIIHAQDHTLSKIDSLIKIKDYASAETCLDSLIAKDSSNIDLAERLVQIYNNSYRYDKAIKILDYIISIDSSNTTKYFEQIASLYKTLGNKRNAANYFEKASIIDSNNTQIKFELGKLLYDLGNLEKSEKIFDELVEKEPDNNFFHRYLGLISFKSNYLPKAVQHFKKALNKYSPFEHLLLGQSFINLGKLDSADHYLRKAHELFPRNSRINKMVGETAFKQKEYVSSIKFFLNATVTGDSSFIVLKKLGISYYMRAYLVPAINDVKMMKLNSAIKFLKKATKLNPDDPMVYFYLGLIHKETEEFEISEAYLNEALNKIKPNYIGDIYFNLAYANEREMDYEEAIKFYQKAIKEKPDSKYILFYLASVYDRYYEDRTVPLIYFKKFLREVDSKDERLVEYAKSRIERLIEENHFN